MNIDKTIQKAFLIAVLAVGLILSFGVLGFAQGRETSVNVHIKVEASNDGGTTWHNYSGTEYSGSETVSANPGDKVYLRAKIWNTATLWRVSDLTAIGEMTNYSYLSTAAVESADADHNGTAFTGSFFSGTGQAAIATVLEGGVENGLNCEILLGSITLGNSFPSGETTLTAGATIGTYTETNMGVGLLNKFFGIAKAEGTGRNSTARISVNVAQALTPTPTSTPTPTPEPTVAASDLPQTGSSGLGILGI